MTSLTRELADVHSPLRAWAQQAFSGQPRSGPDRIRLGAPVVPMRDAATAAVVGMAFDWRLRLGLGAHADERGPAWWGWRLANPDASGPGPVPELLARGQQAAARSTWDAHTATLIAFALSRYESAYRTGNPAYAPHAHDPDAVLEFVARGVAADTITEVDALLTLARDGMRGLFPASRTILNPDLSVPHMRADADLVINDTLVDLKVVKATTAKTEHLWQPVAYWLLWPHARPRERRPDQVGLYFARHGRLVADPVDRWVRRIGWRDSLEVLQTTFDAALNEVGEATEAAAG